MYSVAVRWDFVARHFLLGGDFGAESQLHTHDYRVEVQIDGPSLNQYGFLVDIVEIEARMESLLTRFRNSTLNELEEFKAMNPSIENFARVLCEALTPDARCQNIARLQVRIWENEKAWAAYRQEF